MYLYYQNYLLLEEELTAAIYREILSDILDSRHLSSFYV